VILLERSATIADLHFVVSPFLQISKKHGSPSVSWHNDGWGWSIGWRLLSYPFVGFRVAGIGNKEMQRSHLFLCKYESQHLTYSSFTTSGRMCLIWAKWWKRNRLQEHTQDITLHQFCFTTTLWNRPIQEFKKRNCMQWNS